MKSSRERLQIDTLNGNFSARTLHTVTTTKQKSPRNKNFQKLEFYIFDGYICMKVDTLVTLELGTNNFWHLWLQQNN